MLTLASAFNSRLRYTARFTLWIGFFVFILSIVFYVYILYSFSTSTFYKGQTGSLRGRLDRHNSGYEKYTKAGRPWVLVWYCSKETRKGAVELEKKLKNLSVEKIRAFIKKYSCERTVTGLNVFDLTDQ